MEKKSVIGIVPLIDNEKESYWMLPGYMQGIIDAGGLPVMLPLTDDRNLICQLVSSCDGFLFTGGQDVSPELYGEDRILQCGECSPERDRMETALLEEVLRADKPLLGICRGIQFLNAALEGTLYQDIPTQVKTNTEHHQTPPYDAPVHEVSIKDGSALFDLLMTQKIRVNSYHHQAIKDLSPQLRVMAVSEDGLIEGVYMPGKKFVWAVQWHPEFSYRTDENSRKIFKAFVSSAEICKQSRAL